MTQEEVKRLFLDIIGEDEPSVTVKNDKGTITHEFHPTAVSYNLLRQEFRNKISNLFPTEVEEQKPSK